jgi:spore coat polysaccharide biosynthesis protein SpsF (cytidylyltransferase family)
VIITCIAVRMKSSRCPGKAMADLNGKPLIHRLIDRIHGVTERTVVCTSTNPQDDVLTLMDSRVRVVRGDELDVAGRFLEAARQFNAEHIVRVTGDNPLTCPEMMNQMIATHLLNDNDYTYCLDAPKGTKSEVIRTEALRQLYETQDPDCSEYMTYDLMTLPNKQEFSSGYNRPEVRLTVDTHKDLRRMQALFRYYDNDLPSLEEIIRWYDRPVQ